MSKKIKPIPVFVENTLCYPLRIEHDEHENLNIELGGIRIYIAHAHHDEAIFNVSVFNDEGSRHVITFKWIHYMSVEVDNGNGSGLRFERGSFSVSLQGDDGMYYVRFKYDKDSGNGVIVVSPWSSAGTLVIRLDWQSEY